MKLYNTLSRKTEKLKPLQDKNIAMYNCGLTVYNHPHIGNWVGYIYWDVLQRVLEADGYQVERVQNITDVGHLTDDGDDGEDKLAKGAKREKTTAMAVADKYTKIAEHEAYELLGFKKPKLVRATTQIDQQIAFLSQLEEKGFTYEIPNKGLYFDTSKLDDYGKLAKLDIEGLQSGKRIDDSGKRNPTDFVLWRLSPAGLDANINWEWDSPWGKGTPGWHLECSQIAKDHLGDQIDIHTGGVDHIPVHHTNEIAQTESLTGQQFSRVWLHNNHLKINGGKMSKSLGNIHTLPDLLKKGYNLESFKLLVLAKHYRTEGNFTWKILTAAQNRLQHWQTAFDQIQQASLASDAMQADLDELKKSVNSIMPALNNDLDTPVAVAKVDEIASWIDNNGAPSNATELLEEALQLVKNILNIKLDTSEPPNKVYTLLQERGEARLHKDWEKSDKLRDQLKTLNYGVEDGVKGQRWFKLVT